MRMFDNRDEAGRLLAEALAGKAGEDWMVLAIPRGGVVVGRRIADALKLQLDIVIPRKLGAPGDPELAIGAVSGDGTIILDERLVASLGVPGEYVREEAERQQKEISRRLRRYRGNVPLPVLKGRGVILVDDGIATGSTIKAALASVRKMGARPVVIAVPVAPHSIVKELEKEADAVVCLQAPPYFQAVGQFYRDFPQTSDEEVRRALGRD